MAFLSPAYSSGAWNVEDAVCLLADVGAPLQVFVGHARGFGELLLGHSLADVAGFEGHWHSLESAAAEKTTRPTATRATVVPREIRPMTRTGPYQQE